MPADYTTHDELVVLTGDLVASSRMTPAELEASIFALDATAADMTRTWGSGGARFTRFRGDGWQCLAPPPARALRTALVLQARLRALGPGRATRISVGIGPGSVPAEGGLSAAFGPAFEVSGRGLDAMGSGDRVFLNWTEPPPGADLLRAIFLLCDEISRGWTPRQAETLTASLLPAVRPTQQALAEALGVSQQTVAGLLRAAGQHGIAAALAAVER